MFCIFTEQQIDLKSMQLMTFYRPQANTVPVSAIYTVPSSEHRTSNISYENTTIWKIYFRRYIPNKRDTKKIRFLQFQNIYQLAILKIKHIIAEKMYLTNALHVHAPIFHQNHNPMYKHLLPLW